MAQKIKVQDGNIVFSTSDPALNINFGIKGSLDVTKNITVGDDPSTPGVITTSVDPATNIGQNLNITTGSGISGNGNLNLTPTGVLSLNSVLWPNLSSTITSGSFIGASSLNTLAFYPFIFAYTGSDTLTTTQLNILYPSIQPGQYVIGPTVVYACIATGTWRITGAPLGYTPVNRAGDTMTGFLILNASPVNDLGAVTKQYVDQIATGINIHGAVLTSTTLTANLSSNTYTPGVSGGSFDPGGQGVGATLTSTANVNINTAGVGGNTALQIGSRILVKDQSSTIQNGVYVVTSLGVNDPAGSQWILTRASDYNNSQVNEVHAGDVIFVQEGTLSGTQWAQTSAGTGTSGQTIIGTDTIVFSQFAGAGTFTSGPGINISGNVISNTGVLNNIAGAGISMSTSTGNVTVTNTGVIGLISGPNISLSGSSGTITVGVIGSINVVAGTGITVTGSPVSLNGSVTIANSGVTAVSVNGGTTGLTTSGGPITTTGTITLGGTLSIANGGTGQITANNAFNALAPSQTASNGKLLTSDGTTTSWSNQIWVAPTGSVAIGAPVTAPELTTTATDGFFYIPSCPGVPTGVPTTIPGRAPMVIDSVNKHLYIYAGGVWVALNLATYS